MYIDASSIIQFGAVIGVLGTCIGIAFKTFRWVERQKEQDEEIACIKAEQCIICYSLLATLDGLKQLGANGNVTDAYNKLEKHLNQQAHHNHNDR